MHARFASLAILVLLTASRAHAHPVTVDGDPAEWSTRAPNAENLGIVVRDAGRGGELVWRDVASDARTDLATPEAQGEMLAFQVTATPTALFFLVRRAPGAASSGSPVQIQIAIDLDRVDGSGQQYFAGFADTQVASGARWERLVQTLFGSGGQAQVIDTSFTTVATAQAVVGTGGDVEISVPWSALGLTEPPIPAIRLSVATFRATAADLTVDIGGASVSNALDVLTDYGDPRATAHPNTWQEVMDGIVDDWLDVWVDDRGEVYAPFSIDRFLPAGGTAPDELVVIRNVSRETLSLAGFGLGDEETPDGVEGMTSFPAGASVAPGARYVIARNGAAFQTYFGVAPDAELPPSTSAAVPDMVPRPSWAAAPTMSLTNAGDEVLLLDPTSTIIDVAVFGLGTYAGITPLSPGPPTNVMLTRNSWSADTDDCAVDFRTGLTCTGSGSCPGAGACWGCVAFACGAQPGGTPCADADVCDGEEACDGTGTCADGTPLSCDDGTVCTIDRCDAAIGGCIHTPLAPGSSCADGDLCNGNEVCDASHACVAGTPIDCDDGNPCTADTCSPMGICEHAPVAAGTPCTDADPCNGEECDGSGSCGAGPPPSCEDGNTCTLDECDPTAGCTHIALLPGLHCDDGDPCTESDTCDDFAVCVPGPSVCDLDAGIDGGIDAGGDGGGVELDAAPSDDAATADDAGTRADGGTRADAGRVDAGPVDPDLGSSSCACRAGAGGGGGGAWAVAIVLGVVVARRTRRRRG